MVAQAPACFASAAFSSEPTLPIRRAPSALAHWQGDQPNPAGGGMEQEHFTRLHVVGLAQQVVHRQPFEERSGALLKAEVVRQQRHFSSGTLWTSL